MFPDGVSSIKDISAGTKVGILFAIILAALTQDGKDVLLNEANISIKKQSDMIEAFEMLLCYWAWLKKEEYWACHDMDALQRAKTAICKTVSQLLLLFPRSSGCQWKIPKMHEQLHTAHNIYICLVLIKMFIQDLKNTIILKMQRTCQREHKNAKNFLMFKLETD